MATDIINDLKTENNFAFGELYQRNLGKIQAFVTNNSGTNDDAEDLFQDAMVVLVEKLRQDHFKLTASIDTYVYAICKNLWFKKLRNRSFEVSEDKLQTADFIHSIEESIIDEMNYMDKLKYYITQITDHCSRMIHDMFFKGKAIEQIQQEYGYSHKCPKRFWPASRLSEKTKV